MMVQSDFLTARDQADSWAYNKHFLITGASSGIGLQLSKHLLGVCRRLTLVSRDTNGRLSEAAGELQEMKKRLRDNGDWIDTGIDAQPIDVRDRESIRSLVRGIYEDQAGQIDAFVNCAGGSHKFALLERMSIEDIDEIIDVNGKAPIYWLRELLPYMKHNVVTNGDPKRAHIVMLSSRSGERALPNLSVYAAAKACVEKLLEAVRAEYACYRIAFTLINPGSINTAFTDRWPADIRDLHNAESMSVTQAIAPILHALDSHFVYNKISYESLEQWFGEPGVLSNRVD